jgi:hypothetical protein
VKKNETPEVVMTLRSRVFPALIVLLCCLTPFLQAQTLAELPSQDAPLTVKQVVAKLAEMNRERALALHEFAGLRVYRLQYQGLGGSKEAVMEVQMNFRAPATKSFTVTSQDGSKAVIEHVFKKLLESEQEALDEENHRASALTLENYEFTLQGREQTEQGEAYVFYVKPRTRNKFLYQGKIWVSTTDFAVTQIQAMPAKSPSFWVKKTQFEHRYKKVGDFWLPARNRTESQIRLGGHAVLTVEYTNYRIVSAVPLGASDQAGVAW